MGPNSHIKFLNPSHDRMPKECRPTNNKFRICLELLHNLMHLYNMDGFGDRNYVYLLHSYVIYVLGYTTTFAPFYYLCKLHHSPTMN
jgi:hypothetical protein